MHTVAITPRAFKQMRKFPLADRAAIIKAVKALKDWPDCRNVKSLTSRDDYRLRVGDFRAIFTVYGDTITVTEVRRRDERTY
ncbi:MAG: type II toxin-antitoxin system RelE/ParE family toxin [Desulfovibrio sp.]|nr:type II toxin-antitoxin system RelE/ParE family toxin [Desulfovibrio sp.]